MNKILVSQIVLLLLVFTQTLKAAEYKVAVRAHYGVQKAIEQWKPTIDMLNQATTNDKFSLLPIISLEEISQRAGSKGYDFLLTNPSSYVDVHIKYQAEVIATLNNKRANMAQKQFGSVIFTHVHNTDILKISDLKDKTLMVVSKRAFGGWRVAWLEMLDQGFDPERSLKKLMFTKSRTQAEVVQAVLSKKVDAGVVRTDLLERLETAGKIDIRYLRILNNQNHKSFPFFLSTRLYPEWAFAALKHVPVKIINLVKESLVNIKSSDHAAMKGRYIGWLPPSDYSSVKALMQKLSVGLNEK